MSDDSRRFVIRDRNWHPKALTPDYKTSVARSPRQALVSIPQSLSETTGPDFSHLRIARLDNDLLRNFDNGGLPVGSGSSSPGGSATNTASRCPIPWWKCGRPMPEAAIGTRTTATWRPWTRTSVALGVRSPTETATTAFAPSSPAPIHGAMVPTTGARRTSTFSISGPSIATRLVTQLYFEGDPLIPLCPIVKSIADPAAVQSLIARLDMGAANPMDCLAYRFDIVLRGQRRTHFENC